jgi:hypothetical protein
MGGRVPGWLSDWLSSRREQIAMGSSTVMSTIRSRWPVCHQRTLPITTPRQAFAEPG